MLGQRQIEYREPIYRDDPTRLIEQAFLVSRVPTRTATATTTTPTAEPDQPVDTPEPTETTETTSGIKAFLTKEVSLFGFDIPMFLILGGVGAALYFGSKK